MMSISSVVEARDGASFAAASMLLAEERIAYVQLDSFIAQRRAGTSDEPRILLSLTDDERPVALASLGQIVYVSPGPQRHIKQLGREIAARVPDLRLVSGEPAIIDYFLHGYRDRRVLPPIKLDARREVFVLRRRAQPTERAVDITVRFAKLSDYDVVANGHSALVLEEFGYDPRERIHFREQLARQIFADRWWIGENSNGPHFICARGAQSSATVRLENVWTPVASRGKGFAAESLRQITRALLREAPSVSVTVDNENIKAAGLYRRLGFEPLARQRSVFFRSTVGQHEATPTGM